VLGSLTMQHGHSETFVFPKRAAWLGGLVLLPVLAFGGLYLSSVTNRVGTARFVFETSKRLEAMPRKGLRKLRRIGVLKPLQLTLDSGVMMEIDPLEYSGEIILTTGAWEPEVLGILKTVLIEGSVFVDVGAHVGYYSLQAAKVVGPSGSIIGVEPNPPIAAKLRHNVKLNGFTNIKVFEAACTDSAKRVRFFPSAEESSWKRRWRTST
jgi:hypothetical protein